MTPEQLTALRQQYAGMAMQAVLSNNDLWYSTVKASESLQIPTETAVARVAVGYADAMLKELETNSKLLEIGQKY